ncbi:MAG: DUF2147 domain-containing protein [Acidobacteriota bacterium]|nr:DUF2147 domain-containing protein [Acidobacteriota bacterium]
MLPKYCRLATFAFAAILISDSGIAAEAGSSPAGLWKTFDDRTREPRGTVRISEENGIFFGRIESTFKPDELNERCGKCPGDRRNAPIQGLIIIRGMRKNGFEYDGGEILDPETGNVYRCKFSLSPDGRRLSLRGYVGLSVFGRTQTWLRLAD